RGRFAKALLNSLRHYSGMAGRSELRSPIAVNLVRTEGETGSGFSMSVHLFGEPLKPLPIFLGTCALTFVFYVSAQFAPGDAHCAAQQFVDYVQRNHARKHRITQRFKNAGYGLDRFKKTRISFDL